MRQLTEVTKYLVQTTGRHGYKQEKIFFVVDHGSLGKFDTNHAGAVSLKIIVGYALQGDVGIVHQCNCYHAVETILWIHPLNYASFVPPSSGAVDILVYCTSEAVHCFVLGCGSGAKYFKILLCLCEGECILCTCT
jgi:hypothetical protein